MTLINIFICELHFKLRNEQLRCHWILCKFHVKKSKWMKIFKVKFTRCTNSVIKINKFENKFPKVAFNYRFFKRTYLEMHCFKIESEIVLYFVKISKFGNYSFLYLVKTKEKRFTEMTMKKAYPCQIFLCEMFWKLLIWHVQSLLYLSFLLNSA